jgi:hypothetical protein
MMQLDIRKGAGSKPAGTTIKMRNESNVRSNQERKNKNAEEVN